MGEQGKRQWIQRKVVPADSAAKSEAGSPIAMPAPIWDILRARAITTPEAIENLVTPKLRDLAHPFSLDQMDRAVDRLITAFKQNEPILLYGDYDLDGTPGIALLRDGLERLGFSNIFTFQPSRMRDGYGVHANLVMKFAERGVRLVVTVDVGIGDIEAISEIQKSGIEVIVTDHHLPKDQLPAAIAVVNPNKGVCGSSLQHLCGTGVAFYLVLALRMELERQGLLKSAFDPKQLLDLFALATVSDLVPLVRENRVLVKHGLKVLAKTERPGLRILLGELGLYGRNLTAQDIGFRLAPKLNALTRLEEEITAFEVLTADESSARANVEKALHLNEKRRALQDFARGVALKALESHFSAGDPFLFVYSHEFHPGVISLVASDLMSQYCVPTFVGAVRDDGRIVGSARAPEGEANLQTLLQAASSRLTRFGGHRYAAGFEVPVEFAEELRESLRSVSAPVASSEDASAASPIYYDAEMRLADLSSQTMSWYEALGPFGNGFEAPTFLLRGLRVKSVRKLKNKFLRYTLSDGLREIEAPWFQNPVEFQKGSQIDIIFEPQWNEYQGRRTIQARIQAAREA